MAINIRQLIRLEQTKMLNNRGDYDAFLMYLLIDCDALFDLLRTVKDLQVGVSVK